MSALFSTEEELLSAAVEILKRRHGSPLIWPTNDGVTVAKNGVWAHGKTLPEALVKMRENLEKAEEARKAGGCDG